MDPKIERFREVVATALEGKHRPAIMFSGGKDSLVMVHLLRSMGKDFEVLFHREPWLTHKWQFAEYVIRSWGMTSYDYPPIEVSMWEGKGILAFTNYYQIGVMPDGRAATLALPKNILEPEPGKPFACGLLDVIRRPTGTFTYPWDVVFIGHKSSDEDQIAGKVPLHADTVDNEAGPRLAFPLRDWTDAEVWEYTKDRGLPINSDRYGADGRDLPLKIFNPDYIEVCVRCIDRREQRLEVECPKLRNNLVPNQSAGVPYRDISLAYFGI